MATARRASSVSASASVAPSTSTSTASLPYMTVARTTTGPSPSTSCTTMASSSAAPRSASIRWAASTSETPPGRLDRTRRRETLTIGGPPLHLDLLADQLPAQLRLAVGLADRDDLVPFRQHRVRLQ